jgi:CHASE3 domain sensor protein
MGWLLLLGVTGAGTAVYVDRRATAGYFALQSLVGSQGQALQSQLNNQGQALQSQLNNQGQALQSQLNNLSQQQAQQQAMLAQQQGMLSSLSKDIGILLGRYVAP